VIALPVYQHELQSTNWCTSEESGETLQQLLSRLYGQLKVRELVETEYIYVQNLEKLHNLKEHIERRRVLDENDIYEIFGNLDAVLNGSRKLLADIENMNLQPEDKQKWGSLFAMHKQTFGAHIQYIAHQRRATIAARREFGKISQIDHEITADINTLEMYLVRPFPRLGLLQFPLLLKVEHFPSISYAFIDTCRIFETDLTWTRRPERISQSVCWLWRG
jgi:hypothetical protein